MTADSLRSLSSYIWTMWLLVQQHFLSSVQLLSIENFRQICVFTARRITMIMIIIDYITILHGRNLSKKDQHWRWRLSANCDQTVLNTHGFRLFLDEWPTVEVTISRYYIPMIQVELFKSEKNHSVKHFLSVKTMSNIR